MNIVLQGRCDAPEGVVFDTLVFRKKTDPVQGFDPVFVSWRKVTPAFAKDGSFKIIYEDLFINTSEDFRKITDAKMFDDLELVDVAMDGWVGNKPPTYVYVDHIVVDGPGYGVEYHGFGAVNGCPEEEEEEFAF